MPVGCGGERRAETSLNNVLDALFKIITKRSQPTAHVPLHASTRMIGYVYLVEYLLRTCHGVTGLGGLIPARTDRHVSQHVCACRYCARSALCVC